MTTYLLCMFKNHILSRRGLHDQATPSLMVFNQQIYNADDKANLKNNFLDEHVQEFHGACLIWLDEQLRILQAERSAHATPSTV